MTNPLILDSLKNALADLQQAYAHAEQPLPSPIRKEYRPHNNALFQARYPEYAETWRALAEISDLITHALQIKHMLEQERTS